MLCAQLYPAASGRDRPDEAVSPWAHRAPVTWSRGCRTTMSARRS